MFQSSCNAILVSQLVFVLFVYAIRRRGGTNFKVKISFLIHSFLAQFLSLFFPRNLDLVAATLRFKGTCIKESHESDVQKKNFD